MERAASAPRAPRRRIPPFLRELRGPWLADLPSGRLAHLVRFASTLTRHDGHKAVVQYVSGGGGTIIEERVDDDTYAELERIMAREYFGKVYGKEAAGARAALEAFLDSLGVKLVVSSEHVPRGAYEMARDAFELLPEGHVGHDSFRTLELGGWGHGAAKCSEYQDGAVRMFSFAVKGPRRNFAALLLHETGHAYFAEREHADPAFDARLRGLHREVVKHSRAGEFLADTRVMPFAVDYLLGVQSRVAETLSDAREFAAEVYLLYVVRGVGLERGIAELPGRLRGPWEKVHEAYRGFFAGVEYE